MSNSSLGKQKKLLMYGHGRASWMVLADVECSRKARCSALNKK
jgi:hypothetical protein